MIQHPVKLSQLWLTFLLTFLIVPLNTSEAGWLFPSPEELLAKAAETGDVALARKAIAKGAEVNARIRYQGDDNWTALSLAVRRGHISEVGEDAQRKHLDVVEFLLEHGADVNAKAGPGLTPLMFAGGDSALLNLLLEHGADIHATSDDGLSALQYAAIGGSYGTAMFLLEHGADINVTTNSGETLLIFAARGQDPALAEYLIEQGFDVNVATSGGRTALMNAADYFSRDVMKLLLEHGADPNAEMTFDRTTALMIAAGHGDPDTGRILLEHGANVRGEAGRRVLSRVLHGGRCFEGFIDLLREYGVDTAGKHCRE